MRPEYSLAQVRSSQAEEYETEGRVDECYAGKENALAPTSASAEELIRARQGRENASSIVGVLDPTRTC
jgi:hypothetical protein